MRIVAQPYPSRSSASRSRSCPCAGRRARLGGGRDDHSHLLAAGPWFQPRRRAVILCLLPPDQSLGESVDPPSAATFFAATRPDSAAHMAPAAMPNSSPTRASALTESSGG